MVNIRYSCCECCWGMEDICLLEPHVEPCEVCQRCTEEDFWKELG